MALITSLYHSNSRGVNKLGSSPAMVLFALRRRCSAEPKQRNLIEPTSQRFKSFAHADDDVTDHQDCQQKVYFLPTLLTC
jgi:hypothetical protein